jgi:hypothetical protein
MSMFHDKVPEVTQASTPYKYNRLCPFGNKQKDIADSEVYYHAGGL